MEELLDLHTNLHQLEQHLLVKHKAKANETLSRPKRELTANLFNSPDTLTSDENKRNNASNDAISKVIQEIQDTLETLELKFVEHDWTANSTSKTGATRMTSAGFVRGGKFPKVGGRVGTRCYIESPSGKVNCSDVIYDDEKTWRKSRSQIDMLIKVLKDKITHLKDIKKQLRESKQQQQQGRHLNNEFIHHNRGGDNSNTDMGSHYGSGYHHQKGRHRGPYGSSNHQTQQHHNYNRHHQNGGLGGGSGAGNSGLGDGVGSRRKIITSNVDNSEFDMNYFVPSAQKNKNRNQVPNTFSTTTPHGNTTPSKPIRRLSSEEGKRKNY